MATHGLPAKRPIALIVEDDPLLRELAAASLEESDLRVVECEDAEQAFASLCNHGEDIALIFADVRLPGLEERSPRRALLVAASLLGSVIVASAAVAAECPADKKKDNQLPLPVREVHWPGRGPRLIWRSPSRP